LISFSIIFGLPLYLSACNKAQERETSLPIVEVVEVVQRDVPVYSEWIGSTDGLVNATIRAQVQGYLIGKNYKEGDFVQKGQVLFEIDPRLFEAALEQAEAASNQAKATLGQSRATLEQAKADVVRLEAQHITTKANLRRIKPLAEQHAVSQKDLDDAVGAEQSADAAVKAGRAGVNAAEAAVEAAQASTLAARAATEKVKLDLSFTRISSPIHGIAGIAKAQIGNLVGPGSIEELTTVSTVDPIKVYISMSEQEYMRDVQNGRGFTQQVPLEMILADGSVHPHPGRFAFADRQVDIRTGTIKVAALFPNPKNVIRPGQYAKIRARAQIKKGALIVPQRAVTELQGSYQVAVVGDENRVAIRTVKVGERIERFWVITEGLKSGEKVIAEGVQKARQGLTVSPKPFQTESGRGPGGKPQGSVPGASVAKPQESKRTVTR
jgi:membrane fusion protein (multidrug efflux system)